MSLKDTLEVLHSVSVLKILDESVVTTDMSSRDRFCFLGTRWVSPVGFFCGRRLFVNVVKSVSVE